MVSHAKDMGSNPIDATMSDFIPSTVQKCATCGSNKFRVAGFLSYYIACENGHSQGLYGFLGKEMIQIDPLPPPQEVHYNESKS